mmetsp:Transcript_50790/g.99876  ORF Transcript_50790/g.99876 Transcript_50790/m.99876 type:complete len:93 (-) Transcript_50790:203-481(-)
MYPQSAQYHSPCQYPSGGVYDFCAASSVAKSVAVSEDSGNSGKLSTTLDDLRWRRGDCRALMTKPVQVDRREQAAIQMKNFILMRALWHKLL